MKRFAPLLLAVSVLAACSNEPEGRKEAPVRAEGDVLVLAEGEKGAAFLKLEPVARDQGNVLRLPGRLVWNEERTVRVFPPLAGRVVRLAVEPGAAVKAGETLAMLTSADFGQANADWRKAKADADLSTKALARSRELREAGVIAEKDWQQAEADHARAGAEEARAASRLKQLGGARGEAQTYALQSPIAGVVVERNLNPGQELRPDSLVQPPFVVTDPASLWVQLDASEVELPLLKPGAHFSLEARQYPGERFSGEIAHVADFIDPVSRTLKVRGTVPNPERRLKGEMFVNVEVEVPANNRLRVPAAAVLLQGSEQIVFVEEVVGRYRRQKVVTGPEREGRLEILSGLKEGDRIVVDGNLHLLKFLRPAAPKP